MARREITWNWNLCKEQRKKSRGMVIWQKNKMVNQRRGRRYGRKKHITLRNNFLNKKLSNKILIIIYIILINNLNFS